MFGLKRFVVSETSMLPTLQPGDGLVAVRSTTVRRGQIRCFEHPDRPGLWLVKRVGHIRGESFEAVSDNPGAPGVVDSRRFGDVPIAGSYRVVRRFGGAGAGAGSRATRHDSGVVSTIGAMAVYLCHAEPDLYEHDATVVDVRPGAVALDRSAFHPGGGGQVSDVGRLEWSSGSAAVTHIEVDGDIWWHVLDEPAATPTGPVSVTIDASHRLAVASLHTMSHVLNAFVFDEFAGALVTGAQIGGDGRGRMDFDLPEVDNDRLRALEDPINEVIARGVAVTATYVPVAVATPESGLMRSMSVAPPPTPDGTFRVIDVDGVDRQACGGTHLSNTGQSRPIRITKVENKGRHNRRVRFQFVDE